MKARLQLSGWRIGCGLLGGVIVALPTLVGGNTCGPFLLSVLLAVIVFAGLLLLLLRDACLYPASLLLMMILFFASTWLLNGLFPAMHYEARWLFSRTVEKQNVFSSEDLPPGDYKHIVWDSWGFAPGGDTTVYLVFDPNDTLAYQLTAHNPLTFSIRGVPCEIWKYQRLENHWYTVTFYTDLSWDHCRYD